MSGSPNIHHRWRVAIRLAELRTNSWKQNSQFKTSDSDPPLHVHSFPLTMQNNVGGELGFLLLADHARI